MESIVHYDDYKTFIRAYIAKTNQRGIITRLANAAGCRPSYLSQVLTLKVQLTPDHAIGITNYLRLSPPHKEYFLLLVDYQRASTPQLSEYLVSKMKVIRENEWKLEKRLSRNIEKMPEQLLSYYKSWAYIAVHLATSIKGLSTSSAISKRLGLNEKWVAEILNELLLLGLVTHKQGKWEHSGAETHVDRASPYIIFHLNNWRQLAITHSQTNAVEGIHFSGVYTVSRSKLQVLKEKILATMEEINHTALSSMEETLFCLNVDFFEL